MKARSTLTSGNWQLYMRKSKFQRSYSARHTHSMIAISKERMMKRQSKNSLKILILAGYGAKEVPMLILISQTQMMRLRPVDGGNSGNLLRCARHCWIMRM